MSNIVTLKRSPQTVQTSAQIHFERPPMLPQSVTNEMLLMAVKNASLGAKNRHVAELLGVPEGALDYWTNSKEWRAIRAQLEPEIQKMVVNTMQDMVGKCFRELNDRLEYGEKKIHYTKGKDEFGNRIEVAEERREPLNASTLMSLASTLLDKSDRMDRKNKGLSSPEEDAVSALAKKLNEMGKSPEIKNAIDAEVVHEADDTAADE